MRYKRKNINVTNRAYKYRLYPNNTQKVLLNKTFGCVRFIYNSLLYDSNKYYELTGNKLKREVTYYKNNDKFSFLKEVDSLALANAKQNLSSAYEGYFKKKRKAPRFKKKNGINSYTTNNVNDSIRIDGNRIRLPKIGSVKTKQDRLISKDEIIKSVTVSKVADMYYISIITEQQFVPVEKLDINSISDDKILGIDFSVPKFYVDSNNYSPKYPKAYRKYEKKLAEEQRKLSNKVKFSNNWYKQNKKVQKISHKITNVRKDFLHKESRRLVNTYDVICFEDINLQKQAKKKKEVKTNNGIININNGKSVYDTGFGMFRTFVQYKLEREGKYFIKIDKWYRSTKTCSKCININNDIDINTKEWVCPICGSIHERDYNAAINIKREGKQMLTA